LSRSALGLAQLKPYIDLIELRDGECIDFFARNWQGVHVPITAMSAEEQQRAWETWKWNVHQEAA
jgi:hypothetical protein